MTTAFWASDRVYVCIVRDREPTDSEWDSYLDLCKLRAGKDLCVLVDSFKTRPNAKQRKALSQLINEHSIDYRAAILTESLVTRGIVTALAWMSIPQRAFAPGQHSEAASFLGFTASELETALQALSRLRQPSLRYANAG